MTSISNFDRDSDGELLPQDIRLSLGGNLALVTGVDEVAERVMAAVRFRLGEDKWVPAFGLNYKLIFSRPVSDRSLLIAFIENFIRQQAGVEQVSVLDFDIDGSGRLLSLDVSLRTSFGETRLQLDG